MIDMPTAKVPDRRAHERRNGRRFQRAAARYLPWVPLMLIVLSFAGLVLTPMVLRQRTRNLRADVRRVAEPTRLLLGELRLGLARELSLAQRFALSPQSQVWFAYHRASARGDSVLARLEGTLGEIGPGARSSVLRLREMVNRWRQLAAMDERRAPEDFMRQSIERGAMYEDVLRASLRVDTVVATAMQIRRARVEASERLNSVVGVAFALLGCAALGAVLALTIRSRMLEQLLRRRAEEEESLRRLAARLSGAFTVNEVAQYTVAAALDSSRIGGAYVARALDSELVVVSGGGSCTSATGTHGPLPNWLTDGRNSDHPRIYTTEVHTRSGHGNGAAEENGNRGRSLLIVPLRHENKVIGTLGVASAGGRRQFGDSSIRFGRTLGDLAAVALHRAQALEREQQARSVAEAAVRTRDAVVSIVSHDLRNPLMAISGSADLLLELMRNAEGRDVERAQIGTLKSAADGMHRLIRDLLDVTRLDNGPLPIHSSRLSIVEVVEEVMGMFQMVVRARRLTLHHQVADGVPAIRGDRDRLAQAISNLLANAVKFTPEGGRVSLAVDVHPNGVRVCVSDTGPGIPPEHIPHLFDRFWQASRNDRRGLGLGLSIVKAIVDAHGGSVHVDSAAGKGSTFCILLPVADGKVATAKVERPAIRRDGRGDGRGGPILPDVPTIRGPTPSPGRRLH